MDPREAAIYEQAGFRPSTAGGNGAATPPSTPQNQSAPAVQQPNTAAPAAQTPPVTPGQNAGSGNGQAGTPPAGASANGAAKPTEIPAQGTPASTTPAPAPTFDESAYLSELFGDGIKSKDQAKQTLAQTKTLSDKIKKLEAQIATGPTFANESLKAMNDAALKGISIENFQMAQTIGDVTKLDDQKALILQAKTLHNLTTEEATKLINRKYNFGEGYDSTTDDVQVAQLQAKIDAQAARKSLSELQVKMQTPPQQVKEQEALTAWKDPITNVGSKTKELNFDITDDDGKTVLGSVKYPVSEEMSKQALEYVQTVIKNAGLPVNEENIAWAEEEYQREVVWQNHQAMIGRAYKNALNEERERWIVKTQNPSVTKEENVNTGTSTDPQLDFVKKQYEKQGRSYVPEHERAPSI